MKNKLKIILTLGLFSLWFAANAQIADAILKKYPAHIITGIRSIIIRANLPGDKQEELAHYYADQDSLAEVAKAHGAKPEEISNYYQLNAQELSKILTPAQLIRLNMGNNASLSAKAIKYRQALDLTQKQVDDLQVKPVDESAKNADPVQTKKLEFEKLHHVLNKEQFEQYFSITNKDKAQTTTTDYMKQLKKYALVKSADTAHVSAEILDFTHSQLINLDKTTYSNPEKVDSIKKSYMYLRPYILIKLDAYKDALPSIIWVSNIISNRQKLNLSSSQIDSLLYNDIELERKRYANKFRYANDYSIIRPEQMASITRILTDEQYTAYLMIKNYNHSLFNADKDWADLKSAGLIIPQIDRAKLMNENQAYELNWLVADERQSNNKSQQNVLAKQDVINAKPEILKKLDVVNNAALAKIAGALKKPAPNKINNNDSELIKAIKYGPQLGLSPKQTDELKAADSKQKAQPENTTNAKQVRLTLLQQILSKDQFQQYFNVANRDKALESTKDSWKQLKKYALVNNTDSIRVNDEIYQSALNQLVSLDKIALSHPENADSIRKAYIYFRPYILIKLDAFKNTMPSIIMVSGILSNREKLNLTGVQIDSLIYNDINAERKKYAARARYSDGFLNIRPEQIASITRILTDEQYTAYLKIKNYKHSLFNADNDWAELKKAKLITPQIDSTRVMTDIQAYELNGLVVGEKLSNNKTQANVFARQRIIDTKPDLLKKLDAMNNETVANKRLKDAFAW
jgi:hypothetical protein